VPLRSPTNESVAEWPRFAPNITGFVRHEQAIAFNLSEPTTGAGESSPSGRRLRAYLDRLNLSSPLFHPLATWSLPESNNLTSSKVGSESSSARGSAGRPSRNETLARELRGSFPWLSMSPSPPSIWADATAVTPTVDPSSVPPRTHSLALTLREGLWGHAYNHPDDDGGSAPLQLAMEGVAADSHRWTNVKGSLDLASIAIDGDGDDAQQSWTVQGCHHRQNGTLYLLGSVECASASPFPVHREVPVLD
jgi:hypothetical protein